MSCECYELCSLPHLSSISIQLVLNLSASAGGGVAILFVLGKLYSGRRVRKVP